MSGTADIVRALGGPRLVPAKSPGQLRALVRAGLPYASLAAVAAAFELPALDAVSHPAHPPAHPRPAQEGAAALGRGVGPAGPPRPHRRPGRGGAGKPGRGRTLARGAKIAASAAGRRSPSSTRTSARRRSRASSCASPTESSARPSTEPVRVWRLCKKAHAVFDGEGARRAGGRWNRRGTRGRLRLAEPVARGARAPRARRPRASAGRSRRHSSRRPRRPARRVDRGRGSSPRLAALPRSGSARRPRQRLGARRPLAGALGAVRDRSAGAELPAEPGASRLPTDPDGKARALRLRRTTHVAKLTRRPARLRRASACGSPVGSTAGLASSRRFAPAARTSSLPSVGRLSAPRTKGRVPL